MALKFLATTLTPSVRAARESFPMATVAEGAWPCLQHHGSAPGFLKLLGRVRVLDAREHPRRADEPTPAPELRGNVEHLFLIELIALDGNCPRDITPRHTAAEVAAVQSGFHRKWLLHDAGWPTRAMAAIFFTCIARQSCVR